MKKEVYGKLSKIAMDDDTKLTLKIAIPAIVGTLGLGLGATYLGLRNTAQDINNLKKRKKKYIGTDLNTPENEDIRQFNKSLMDQRAILESRWAGVPDWVKRLAGLEVE